MSSYWEDLARKGLCLTYKHLSASTEENNEYFFSTNFLLYIPPTSQMRHMNIKSQELWAAKIVHNVERGTVQQLWISKKSVWGNFRGPF